jgi:hypothetical protein
MMVKHDRSVNGIASGNSIDSAWQVACAAGVRQGNAQ